MEIAAAGDDLKRLRAIARALLNKAEGGDMQAIREVADRLDGKPIPHQPDDRPPDAPQPDAQLEDRFAEMAKRYRLDVPGANDVKQA